MERFTNSYIYARWYMCPIYLLMDFILWSTRFVGLYTVYCHGDAFGFKRTTVSKLAGMQYTARKTICVLVFWCLDVQLPYVFISDHGFIVYIDQSKK